MSKQARWELADQFIRSPRRLEDQPPHLALGTRRFRPHRESEVGNSAACLLVFPEMDFEDAIFCRAQSRGGVDSDGACLARGLVRAKRGGMELINHVPNVPAAVGPYSQAVRQGGFLFCSGQIPIDPAEGKIVAQDVEGQARQVLANIQALLSAQGLGMSDVVKATVFLQNMADFPKVNPLYDAAFAGHKPARSTVAVAGLPLGALVEVEVIAAL